MQLFAGARLIVKTGSCLHITAAAAATLTENAGGAAEAAPKM
jgi:hypothetical protein